MNDSAYWDWHQQGLEALNDARLSEAAEAFARARSEALRHRLPLADRAYCNWAGIRHTQDRTTGLEKGLSRILGGSEDPRARQLAAYYLACIHWNQRNLKTARFYGKMAVRLAEALGVVPSRIAGVHLLGLVWLAESRLDEAGACFQQSVDLSAGQVHPHAVMAKSTLGYCLSLQGRRREGLAHLEEALLNLMDLDCPLYEPSMRLNLGFALLEGGDLDGAIVQGRAALELLEQQEGSRTDAKFAYYLLGEGHAQRGAGRQAEEYFEILQKRYYPQYPGLAQMLLVCRTSPLLNWLAQ